MHAVILARVSTEEQEEGHSIAAQTARLRDYCSRLGLPILRSFELVESSTQGHRTEFHGMIEFVRRQKVPVALVADAVDRVQRSFKESALIDDLRRTGRVEVHFLREGLILNEETPAERLLLWDFATLSAKAYVAALSQNVRRSLQFKIRNGEWIGKAPVGYRNVPDPNTGKRIVIVDEERAHHVRRIFELYATGAYSMAAVSEVLRREGLTNNVSPFRPLGTNLIYLLLKNPFYVGRMRIRGQLYAHKYPPLVSEALFRRCQEVRDRFHKRRFKYAAKPFVFRGLIHCAFCGCAVTADRKKDRYTYLCCTKRRGACAGVRVREEVVLAQAATLLRRLAIPTSAVRKIAVTLKRTHAREQAFRESAIRAAESRLTDLRRQASTLLDLRIGGRLTDEEYDRRAEINQVQQRESSSLVAQHLEGDERFRMTVLSLLDVLSKAPATFQSSSVDKKRSLLAFVCSNYTLEGRKLRYELKKPFDAVSSANLRSRWLPLLEVLRTRYREDVLACSPDIATTDPLAGCLPASDFRGRPPRA